MDSSSSSRRFGALEIVAVVVVLAGLGLVGYSIGRSSGEGAAPAADSPAGLNVSCFAYRDANRDGVFGVEDQPYAALQVRGDGPNGTAIVSSNTAGFANFTMLLGSDEAFVDRAGSYEFEALAPDGWTVTSGASSQIVFEELDGAPVGVVATELCTPIGVAPDLTVGAGAGVTIESADGAPPPEQRTVSDDRIEVSASAGTWEVEQSGSTRSVEVVDVPVVVSSATTDRERYEPLPSAVVVGFDDLTSANTLAEVPNGYAGLEWTNMVATHRILYGGPGYVNGTRSGEHVAYNGSGHPAAVAAAEPFDFVGGFVAVAWPGGNQYDVLIEAWRGEELVYADRVSASSAGSVYFDADYRSITRLELSSEANWQFVLDDLEFRLAG